MSEFKKGDVVLNGHAAPGINDLLLITGTTSRKTGKYSTTRYYSCRMLFKGKLQPPSLHPLDGKLSKIGHIDYDGYIISEIKRIRSEATNGTTK